jgi:hypothetical protein
MQNTREQQRCGAQKNQLVGCEFERHPIFVYRSVIKRERMGEEIYTARSVVNPQKWERESEMKGVDAIGEARSENSTH